MEWIILITVVLYIFVYLLFVPFFLEIDTTSGKYSFKIYGIAGARIYISDDTLMLDINITAWHKQIDLFEHKKRQQKVKKKKIKKERRKIYFHKILAVIKSFKIDKLRLIIDSGNEQLNGILFPVFELASYTTGKTLKINFIDRNEFELTLENNLARILWAYIKS